MDAHVEPEQLRKSFLHGFISVVVLSIVDIVTTIWALFLGAAELNPVADFLIMHGWLIPASFLGLVIPLKILVLGLAALRLWSKVDWKQRQVSGIWWVSGVYSLGMVLNIVHILILLL